VHTRLRIDQSMPRTTWPEAEEGADAART